LNIKLKAAKADEIRIKIIARAKPKRSIIHLIQKKRILAKK